VLDEPTNNLDHDARARLTAVVRSWKGCLLIVSHDRALLDEVDRIAALDRGEIRWYGGTYTDCEQAVQAERDVAERRVRQAGQDLRRQKREMQQARERAARRSSTASRGLADAGLARIVAGNLKRSAQVSAAKTDDVHAARVGDAQARLAQASRAAREDDQIALELPGTTVPGGRTIFRGACVLFAEPAPQLLLLDEPTNSLDLVSVAQLKNALAAYQGALVVVSHDERFLIELKVDRWVRLDGGNLTETGAPH
jgi:ATPase subunit of ABC transporter with duplicated ATPase domains